MDYVINPMWFYWLQVVASLRTVCIVIAVFNTIACIILWIVALCELEYCNTDDEDYRRHTRIATILIPISVFAILLGVFIPSKNTLIELQIARLATKQNVEFGIEAIKSATDYVIEAIKQLK